MINLSFYRSFRQITTFSRMTLIVVVDAIAWIVWSAIYLDTRINQTIDVYMNAYALCSFGIRITFKCLYIVHKRKLKREPNETISYVDTFFALFESSIFYLIIPFFHMVNIWYSNLYFSDMITTQRRVSFSNRSAFCGLCFFFTWINFTFPNIIILWLLLIYKN